jgi:hypothetical protein
MIDLSFVLAQIMKSDLPPDESHPATGPWLARDHVIVMELVTVTEMVIVLEMPFQLRTNL